MSSRNGRSKSASLFAFRDLDLLLKIEERGDHDGWVPTDDLASSFGFADHLQPLGIRLSWLRRYGMVERDDKTGLWRVTTGAGRVIDSRMKANQIRTIENLPDETMVEVMANVTSRYRHGDPMVATMLRREFMFGTQRRL
jgi:hypothetical protein